MFKASGESENDTDEAPEVCLHEKIKTENKTETRTIKGTKIKCVRLNISSPEKQEMLKGDASKTVLSLTDFYGLSRKVSASRKNEKIQFTSSICKFKSGMPEEFVVHPA